MANKNINKNKKLHKGANIDLQTLIAELKAYQSDDTQPLEITVRNTSLSIAPDTLDDIEVLEGLAGLQAGNTLVIPALLRTLAGEQYEQVLEIIKDNNGRVSASNALIFVLEILNELSPNS